MHKEIEGHQEKDIADLERQRRLAEEDLANINADIGMLRNDKDRCDNEVKACENEIAKIARDKKAAEKYLATRQLTEKGLDVLKAVYEKFASKKRAEIEKEIKTVFDKLIWKDTIFPHVSLTKNYNLEVYDLYGSPAREELSAGERQVLSLSFIASMATISGGDIPIVMDTPFGRLFSKHRENIVEQIPKLTRQLILMVQDEELRGESKKILKSRLGEEYNLNFDKGCTTIEEV
jgi:DNA sulfur modification protein DndD